MNAGYPPPQTYTIPNNAQLPLYATQQTSPPESMSPTPSDVSPTSPRIHQYLQYRQANQFKQIKEPRTPLYVPAVLRPTERYPKHSPLTPPKSLHGSLDSLEGHHQGETVDDPQQLNPGLETDYFPEEELGEVTGLPTKEHWKPDDASPTCDSPTCRSNFNLFIRKHHCRHCGHIFCSEHTSHTIPLNQNAQFHPLGTPSKACETCSRQYRKWNSIRKRRESQHSSSGNSSGSGGTTPNAQQHHQHHQRGGSAGVLMKAKLPQGGQMGTSAPKDWTWSTF